MHLERSFRVERDRDSVVERLCSDETLLELLPGDTEIAASKGDRRTIRTHYQALGQEGVATFHFEYLLDGNVRFEKVCDGRVWRRLEGSVTAEEDGDGTQVLIEMDGRTKALVPEIAIRGPLVEQIEIMTKALQELLA